MITNWPEPIPKSAEELETERVMEEYEEHFGEPYVFQIGGPAPQTLEDLKREIHELIATNKKQKLVSFPDGIIP